MTHVSQSSIDLVWNTLPDPVVAVAERIHEEPGHPDHKLWVDEYVELLDTHTCLLRVTKSEFRKLIALMTHAGLVWDASNIVLPWPRWQHYMTQEMWDHRSPQDELYHFAWSQYRTALNRCLEFTFTNLPIPSFKLNGNPGWLILPAELDVAFHRYEGLASLTGVFDQAGVSMRQWTRLLLFLEAARVQGQGVRIW